MKTKNITFNQCDGNLHHNNKLSSKDIALIQIPLEQAYNECFEQSIRLYNTTQKRKDRQINESYFKYTFKCEPTHIVVTSANKRKSFYEIHVQIGSLQDTSPKDIPMVIDCLQEYLKTFKQRNSNLYVFNAILHATDDTPHLHIDYIPIGHFKRGIGVQNSISQALREMGYNQGKESINQWRLDERAILEKICQNHGIELKESTPKEDYSQLEEKYKQSLLELSTIKEELTKICQDLNNHIDNVEKISISNDDILNPTGYKEKKKGILSNKIVVEMDINAFQFIQQIALNVSTVSSFDYDTLKRLKRLLYRRQ